MPEFVAESETRDWAVEASVDDDSGLVRNVALCGTSSKNGYTFAESALKEAPSLYENKHVYVNHLPAERRNRPYERNLEDLAGYITNPRFHNGRPYGDIRTEGAPRGEMFRGLVKARIPDTGMSHVASYEFDVERKQVTKIHEVATVDIVVSPATTRTFSEQTSGDNPMSDANTKLAQKFEADWKSEQDARLRAEQELEKFKAESFAPLQEKVSELETSLKTVTEERDELKGKVDKFEAEQAAIERRESINEMLSKHKLDPKDDKVVTKFFIEQLMSVEDESCREELIKDRASLIQSSPSKKVFSQERREDTTDKFDPLKALEARVA